MKDFVTCYYCLPSSQAEQDRELFRSILGISGIRELQAMAKTLLRHAKGILSFYHTGLTSGKMEGINRKIRGLLASAFGFRDDDFLKLRLYALHEAKFTFVG